MCRGKRTWPLLIPTLTGRLPRPGTVAQWIRFSGFGGGGMRDRPRGSRRFLAEHEPFGTRGAQEAPGTGWTLHENRSYASPERQALLCRWSEEAKGRGEEEGEVKIGNQSRDTQCFCFDGEAKRLAGEGSVPAPWKPRKH